MKKSCRYYCLKQEEKDLKREIGGIVKRIDILNCSKEEWNTWIKTPEGQEEIARLKKRDELRKEWLELL